MSNSSDNSLFLRPGETRMEWLKEEKKRVLIEDGDDLSLQDIIYRLIDEKIEKEPK
ncbi:MAG: hypothetical protein QM504_15805 [Pseudomonadota bacterium]